MEQTRENFAFRILLFCIAAPQGLRDRPSEDGVAWNSLSWVESAHVDKVPWSCLYLLFSALDEGHPLKVMFHVGVCKLKSLGYTVQC